MNLSELRRALREAEAERNRLIGELQNLQAREAAGGDDDVDGIRERVGNVNRGITRADERIRELNADIGRAYADLADRSGDERYVDGAETIRREREERERLDRGDAEPRNEHRDLALRTIERHAGALAEGADVALEALVRDRDESGRAARYLTAVGSRSYFDAFGVLLADPIGGHMRMTPEQHRALADVNRAVAERAMAEGTPNLGGYAIPFTLDPSIRLTSDGALNPIRSLARVIQITTREWKGVSSAGVTASYDPEGAEVSDDAPTFGQPEITTAMGRAFVPFSMEIGDDWAGLSRELARLINDGRDVLDAQEFLDGDGNDSPEGILVGATNMVATEGAGAFAIDDVYALRAAIPPRFRARLAFAAHPDVLDDVYRFVAAGDTDEPPLMPTREGGILGRTTAEWSTMDAPPYAAGESIMIAGDFAEGFTIADRLGMTIEPVAHLFGESRRPTGQRGVFARWRSGSAVVNAAALRVLVVST
jgi:HK97 family phage major capsid protein